LICYRRTAWEKFTGFAESLGQNAGSPRLAIRGLEQGESVSSACRIELEAVPHAPPYVLHWSGRGVPLPLRPIRGRNTRPISLPLADPPPWVYSGPLGEPFDFGQSIRKLCADIVQHCTELGHIDVSRLLFGVTQARNGHAHGLQARVTPLRFRNGNLT